MSMLCYDRSRVAQALDDPDTGAAHVAERLCHWTPDDDDALGCELIYRLIQAVPDGGLTPLWRVDLDRTAVTVLAHFSCDNEAFIVYNHELTLSMMINGAFEIADTGSDHWLTWSSSPANRTGHSECSRYSTPSLPV